MSFLALRNLLLAADTTAAAAKAEPATVTVVVTGLVLVFAILVLLVVVLMIEGKIFESIDKKKQLKKEQESQSVPIPAPVAPVAAVPAMPAVEQGIPPEVVAAIAAAVASIEGGRYQLRSVQTAQKGRGQWGLAGVISYTEPF